MYQLTVKSGTNKGTTWLLSDKPLVIGRSVDCDIVIPDSIVSRRHCELRLEGDAAYIRDLGSNNATLVNGHPVEDHEMKVGDEIAIGPYAFILGATAAGQPGPQSLRSEPETPLTVSLSNALYLKESDGDSGLVWMPRSVYEFRDLFLLNRQFSLAGTTANLLQTASAALVQRFDPAGLWYAWFLPDQKDLVLQPVEDPKGGTESAPLDAMRQAVEQRAGLLATNFIRNRKPPGLETTLAAPVALGERLVGAIAMRGVTPARVYDENDLEFLVAVADSLAPHLVAAGRGEQMRRDLNGLSKRAGSFGELIGNSEELRRVWDMSERAAKTDLAVLILGETGVGKELVARSIHDHSERAQRPFVTVNCASIPRDLLESELFGHEKGAFTGAIQRRIGRFEEAHSGTLFLDEIGDLPLDGQVAILRAVETGTFHRIGSSREVQVNVRIIAATNRPIAEDVAEGRFRADLYHRLRGFEIYIPPLRERKKDIPVLAEFFLHKTTTSQGGRVTELSSAALDRLLNWHWPGNVRELRLCIERATVLAKGPTIDPADLVMQTTLTGSPMPDPATPTTLAETEKRHILATLKHCNGNIRATSRALDISRATLYSKLKLYEIEP
jgi:Nif-specific regulatory protein